MWTQQPSSDSAERASSPDPSEWGIWRVCRAGLLAICGALSLGLMLRVVRGAPTAPLDPSIAALDTMQLEGPIIRDRADRPRSPVALALTLAAERRADRNEGARRSVSLGGLPFVPFAAKQGEYMGSVRLGAWPAERRSVGNPRYANPLGFFVVTPELRGQQISTHFTIGQFAMREGALGPRGESYVVLQPELLEKLEATLAELRNAGVPARNFRILSGFRAPHYNSGVEGAAPASRHQYGDAADLIVDDNGDGRMDDLNGDGRVDRADIYLLADAFERVERRSPMLVGGLGLYDATGPSGPFVHVDVRGDPARWGTAARGGSRSEPAPIWSSAPPSATARAASTRGVSRPGCSADAASAILCATRADLAGSGGH